MNHAAVSPLSQGIKETLARYWESRSHVPVDIYPGVMDTINQFREMVCTLLNAESVEEIAFSPNTSTGLNMIASGLEWRAGDRIILNTMEFPSNIYPFMALEKQGVIIDWVEPREGRILPADIEKRVTSGTRMVAISFVQFLNGFTADLETIGRLCKEKKIWFVVDGIQGAGVVPVDVVKCNIDAFVAGGHKWLMWPMGTGFLYASKKILPHLRPPIAGWLSVKDSWNLFDYKLDFLETASKFEPGTFNFIGLAAAHTALSTFLELGITNINRKIMEVTDHLLQGFKKLSLEIVTPQESESRSGIVSIKVPEAEALLEAMAANKIFPAFREGVLRFSPHCGNTIEDADKVLEFLEKNRKKRTTDNTDKRNRHG